MRQTLIFDADDTLWHNNVLFERVIADFIEWLAHPSLDHAAIRSIFNDVERLNTATHGYGSLVFLGSLADTLERTLDRPATEADRAQIADFAVALLEHRVELIEDVPQTLIALAQRHDLLLLTKGEAAEQRRKIEVSGIAQHFRSLNVVPEKNVSVYEDLVAAESLNPDRTWMIGNSPKSDILPARQAGLRAVFIPNEFTWVLEEAALDDADPGVLRLDRFGQLLEHF
ncbi:MAG: hydrolase [Frankiales bacterium]|jgi:putative hydrolase of the HAD superfamily|nr:hydrolase [Frankiales bacterium]